ncbi:MAG: sulfotransferase family 2 domain-containing protein [Rhodobacteraceae bacterium]|nr:sulfotransferase family 2 domain-containing protein [Paracoccaceae bacterium]
MILSIGRSYVFIHIPKTGGTSLALALEDRAMKDDIMLGDTPKAKRRRHRVKGVASRGRLWKHSTLADIEGLVDKEVLAGLFAFTLVRNPWDRAVSYYHWLREQKFSHKAVDLARSLSFGDFVAHDLICASFRSHPAGRYMRASDGIEHCDAFIRIEHFEQDAVPLADHLGFDLVLQIANASERKDDFRQYYTEKTAGIVADCCAEDIARFNYTLE